MDILICIKQVPATTAVEVDPVTGVLKRDGAGGKVNPYDLYAIETAVRLAQETNGHVTALTMGPPQAKEAVLEAIYMGADRGYVLSDRCFAGADVLATSYAISQAVKSLGRFDLIICGKQTTDGDTAQVGAELAEWLGLLHAGNVLRFESVGEDEITIVKSLDRQVITERLKLPCLLCMEDAVNTPRLPSYRRMLKTPEDAVSILTLSDLEDKDPSHYGQDGSPTRVERIFPPEHHRERQLFNGGGEQLSQELYRLLVDRKFIEGGCE